MYTEFMSEKEGILEVVNELINYNLYLCGKREQPNSTNSKSIKKIPEMINYKNRIIMILENYQEQPGLLDPILPQIVPLLMNNSIEIIEFLLNTKTNEDALIGLKCLYQIVYIICKVRGYHTIIKFFSSEVHIFEPVITFLINLNADDNDNWFLLYVLILWTSILGLIPFDIDTIDTKGIIISSLTEYYKKTLTLSGNIRDISAFAISKFLTRPDIIKKKLMDSFINYCVDILITPGSNENIFTNLGVLSALCEIFKNGLPRDLECYVQPIVEKIIKFKFPVFIQGSGIFRKFIAKLTQRVGLVLLKPKFQKWRYKMQLKTLLEKEKDKKIDNEINMQEEDYNDEINYDIDYNCLETLIDLLLSSLSDKEYIVRWSSAKGVGRLCERLTKNMVEDIFQSLYKMFEDEDNEYSWQGACLCIAELCKRGMILPDKLGELIPYLEKALIYEVNKGTFCSGSTVRDSACYVVWALARAYTKDIMKPYVAHLSQSLILTILFDKEVNCRRAASAAFQEHVGRQGYFPHGIDIITEADYFTLGNRANCYLNISNFIAQYPEYYDTIVNYLSFNRLHHVEEAIRQLAAETLGLIVPFNPKYFASTVLPKLINSCYSNTIYVRHGSIIGIGYILVGLSGKWDFELKSTKIRKKVLEGMNNTEKKVLEDSDYRKSFETYYADIKYLNNLDLIAEDNAINISAIPETLEKKKLYSGKGAEIMRSSLNNLIRLVSEANLKIDSNTFIIYFDILIDNLKHRNIEIQIEACEGLKLINIAYNKLLGTDDNLMKTINGKFLDILKLSVTDENLYITRGFTMAIPFFDKLILIKNYPDVLEGLFTNAKMKKTNNNDADTRKYAFESLTVFTIKFMKDFPNLITKDIDRIVSYMLEGLADYEIDKKLGDVGSKVREASIRSLTTLMIELFRDKNSFAIFSKFVLAYLNGLLKQLVEKMGKMRLAAGDSLQKFFYELQISGEHKDLLLTIIPHFEKLSYTFMEDLKLSDFNQITNPEWLEPSVGYKKVMHFLLYPEYSYSIFEGVITSIGGLTEDTQRCAMDSIDTLMKQLGGPEGGFGEDIKGDKLEFVAQIYRHIMQIFLINEKDDRVIENLYNTIALLLTRSTFISPIFLEQNDKVHRNVMKENYDSKNIHKVLSSVDIYYNLLFGEKEEKYNLFNRTLKSLLVLMTHK